MADSSPHVRTSLEELSSAVSTDNWRSVRVRALGRLQDYRADTNCGHMESIAEPFGPYTIPVDMRLLEAPPTCHQVEVFGELRIADGKPYIMAKFFTPADRVDAELYHRATEKLADRFRWMRR